MTSHPTFSRDLRDYAVIIPFSHWSIRKLNVEEVDKQPEKHGIIIVYDGLIPYIAD